MEKEFVPYQEAKELKELGFNNKCLGIYNYENKKNIEFHTLGIDLNSSLEEKGFKIITAPLYQQAFDWFREKYDLDYSLLPENNSRYRLLERNYNIVIYRFVLNLNVQSEILRIDNKIARYNKRENAQLACLQKMIEIVKGI